MIITKIVVSGEPDQSDSSGDLVWNECYVDGDGPRNVQVTIRNFLHDGHYLELYINGGDPLYPTVVYDDKGHMRAVSAGVLGATTDQRAERRKS